MNLDYLLIRYYCNPALYPLHKELNPYTRTNDVLDVRHLWIIYEVINPGDMSKSGSERQFRIRLFRAFAYQLELIGLWEYAVYIILLSDSSIAIFMISII